MKKYFLILWLLLPVLVLAQQSSYRVKTGDTLESIAKVFRVSPNDIQHLNPNISNGLKDGMLLLIPSTDVVHYNKQKPISFSYHIVKGKETLYGLARKFQLSQDDLRRYNISLYSRPLQQGQELTIPIYKEVAKEVVASKDGFVKYVVKPKEGLWRIAKNHGISLQELEKANPNLPKILKEGTEIWLPSKEDKAKKEENSADFITYQVQKAEGFLSLERKFNLTKSQLIALNPEIKDGIRAEAELKIPRENFIQYLKNLQQEAENQLTKTTDNDYFRTKVRSENVKTISFVLPFKVGELQNESEIKDKLQADKMTHIATDFYSGVLMALDSLQTMGFQFNVNVFDSQASEEAVQKLPFEQLNASQLIIGPFRPVVFNALARKISAETIIFAPLSNKNINLKPNIIQSVPTQEVLQQKMISYLKKHHSDAHMLILSDGKNSAETALLTAHFSTSPVIKDPEEIENQLHKNQKNLVLVSSNDVVFLSKTIRSLHSLAAPSQKKDALKIQMVTLDRGEAYEHNSISHSQLSDLKFTFASANRYAIESDFSRKYFKTYRTSPSRYATRGFDITMDAVMRMASQGGFSGENLQQETAYQENKFAYFPNFLAGGGYENHGVYILQYHKLEAKEISQE